MLVEKYDKSKAKLWDQFVDKAKNATFLFKRDFMEYHKDRFEDFSLMIYSKKKELIALFPANRNGSCVYSHQGLTYGGIITKEHSRVEESYSVFSSIIEYLKLSEILKLVYKDIPDIYCSQSNDEFKYFFNLNKATLLKTYLFNIVDLRTAIKLRGGRKNGMKRGKQHRLVVKEENNLDSFWNQILIPNLKNKFEARPVHTLNEIEYLKSQFPNQIRQFNVYHDDTIVAGTTIFETKFVAHSQYASALPNKNLLGSVDFLHYHLITEVFKNKKYFDFGTSHENGGKTINEGLNYWKQSFGGTSKVQCFFELDLTKDGIPVNIFS